MKDQRARTPQARSAVERPQTLPRPALHRRQQIPALRGGTKGVSERGWPARYVARRAAGHSMDHAWEIEDRTP